jgi:sugar phosphate isomerase/epimerase
MWDISWLLRRWPGAGFEDWDQALDELVERGYDAVRLEAFPHLLSVDPDAAWEFIPGRSSSGATCRGSTGT